MGKLWSSRFTKDITDKTLDYTQTIDIDCRMVRGDLWGSLAHTLMLGKQEIVPHSDCRLILDCLLTLFDENEIKPIVLQKELEDVHLNIETIVIQKLGLDIGGKLHTARSRNDQVVTDARLYLREEIIALAFQIINLSQDLLTQAEEHLETVMLGYTHSQPAQPISFAFWLSSYVSIFVRDLQRLSDTYKRVNQNPLGSCALAGTSFPTDRKLTTELLAFNCTILHALDATSSRDFILEAVAALALYMSHISRLGEEVVIWSSMEYGLIEVDDSFCTGSSIMPQKKNPVVAELMRAKACTVFGALSELLGMVKSVSLGYSCDLQQDKPPLWRSIDIAASSTSILHDQMKSINFNNLQAEKRCWDSFSTATELANFLVREKNLSFRESYSIVGSVIKTLSSTKKSFFDQKIVLELLQEKGIALESKVLNSITAPLQVLKRQNSLGGTSPTSTLEIIQHLRAELQNQTQAFEQRQHKIERGLSRTLSLAKRYVSGEPVSTLITELT